MGLKLLPFRPGIIKDNPDYSARGYAKSTQWIRWLDGYAQSRGGWEKHLTQTFEGIACGSHSWTTSEARPLVAFGTECKLYITLTGFIANITPQRTTGTFANNPLATTISDATVVVTHTAHGAYNGDTVFIGNATATGGLTLAPFGTMPAAAFTTSSGSNVVTVSWATHGFSTGWEIVISGSAAVGGITPDGTFLVRVIDANYLQIYSATAATSTATGGGTPTYIGRVPFEITYISANSYSIEASSNASSTASGGGAAVQYLYELNCGRLYGSSGTGFGSSGYSTGGYGSSTASGVSPRDAAVWCLDNFGDDLIASRIGTTIYRWQGNWSARAAVLTNAPAEVQWFLVTPNRTIMALGCTADGGDFDPMLIRFTDSEDPTAWVGTLTNNAGDLKLAAGSRLIGGLVALDAVYVLSDTMLYQIEFVGNFEQMYRDRPLGTGFGLIGPLAVVTLGDALYWVTPEGNFARYNGGSPVELPCQSKQWFKDQLALGQNFKIFGWHDTQYVEITWGFATAATLEVTDYISINIGEFSKAPDGAAGWSVGTFSRTSWQDSEGNNSRLGWGTDGYIYEHENGNGADGSTIDRHVEWAPIDFQNEAGEQGDRVINLNALVIDRTLTSGTLQGYLYFRRYPNGTQTTKGPFDVNSSTTRNSVRGQGRQFGMRLFSSTNNDDWRLGALRGDTSPGSRR